MKVIFVGHSCFWVELDEHILIFDYYRGKLPTFPVHKQVVVFVSHAHHDHFQKEIFTWGKKTPNLSYVISSDVKMIFPEKAVSIAEPDMTVEKGDVLIRTLRSTDEGVAFIIETEEKCIYHAGDLNWWHWEEEDDETWNIPMAEAYCGEIDKIEGLNVDVGFVPVDARQREHYLLGLDYYMKKTNTACVFPMHMWDYAICSKLRSDLKNRAYSDKVVILSDENNEEVVC